MARFEGSHGRVQESGMCKIVVYSKSFDSVVHVLLIIVRPSANAADPSDRLLSSEMQFEKTTFPFSSAKVRVKCSEVRK